MCCRQGGELGIGELRQWCDGGNLRGVQAVQRGLRQGGDVSAQGCDLRCVEAVDLGRCDVGQLCHSQGGELGVGKGGKLGRAERSNASVIERRNLCVGQGSGG